MSAADSDHVARLLAALHDEAAKAAARAVTVVSATFEWIKDDPGAGDITTDVTITRSTRTIVFSRGELRIGDTLVLSASTVHRVLEG